MTSQLKVPMGSQSFLIQQHIQCTLRPQNWGSDITTVFFFLSTRLSYSGVRYVTEDTKKNHNSHSSDMQMSKIDIFHNIKTWNVKSEAFYYFRKDISSSWIWWKKAISKKLGGVYHLLASPPLLTTVCKCLGTEEISCLRNAAYF